MDFKKIIIFSLILVILSVSFVSAADLNNTHETELSRGGDNSLAIDNINLEHVGISDSENVLAEQSDNVKPGSFEDLQREVYAAPEGSVLDLYRDYNGHEDIAVTINKYLTIDGHGHTIDCKNAKGCYAFSSNSGTITLKNINIINGLNDGVAFTDCYNGGAICIKGSAQYTIENCNFKKNYADDYGGAIYNGARTSVYIRNCTFESNYADDQDGGAIYSKGNLYIEDCSFTNNKAGMGGAICSQTDVYIDNTTFLGNVAKSFGGAIYAEKVYINFKQENLQTFTSSFINNCAESDKGGAIYAKGKVIAVNAKFAGNSAKVDGGAILGVENVDTTNCLFDHNTVAGASSNCYGGAIRSLMDANINNSTFSNNYAEDYGGAIYAKNVYININQDNDQDLKSFFLYNLADDDDGGAIYVENNVKATNTEFTGNSAVDYGGAIYAKKDATIYNCTFKENWANDCGGAIYSDTITLAKSTYFDTNTAYKGKGGAIYTNKFENDVSHATFTNNSAGKGAIISDDGGAIYINKENHVTFTQCIFINNHCTDEGGAIYLDSTSSDLALINNTFIGNTADDEGQAVFNKGTYKKIEKNYWGDKKPSENNDILIEWKFFGSNKHHVDSNPRT